MSTTIANVTISEYTKNTLLVTIGALDVYFSYKTPIAYRWHGKLVVAQNEWGTTTGKHLTQIDGGEKKKRIPHSDLMEQLTKITNRMNNTEKE